jgi:SlyX protein
MDERFIDLEMRISHQEDVIDELNKTVYQQQNRIDLLEEAISVLARRLAGGGNHDTILAHEKPPHY